MRNPSEIELQRLRYELSPIRMPKLGKGYIACFLKALLAQLVWLRAKRPAPKVLNAGFTTVVEPGQGPL